MITLLKEIFAILFNTDSYKTKLNHEGKTLGEVFNISNDRSQKIMGEALKKIYKKHQKKEVMSLSEMLEEGLDVAGNSNEERYLLATLTHELIEMREMSEVVDALMDKIRWEKPNKLQA